MQIINEGNIATAIFDNAIEQRSVIMNRLKLYHLFGLVVLHYLINKQLWRNINRMIRKMKSQFNQRIRSVGINIGKSTCVSVKSTFLWH